MPSRRSLPDEASALEQDTELAWDSSIRRDEHADRVGQVGEPAAAQRGGRPTSTRRGIRVRPSAGDGRSRQGSRPLSSP